jgi:hypothetical protein
VAALNSTNTHLDESTALQDSIIENSIRAISENGFNASGSNSKNLKGLENASIQKVRSEATALLNDAPDACSMSLRMATTIGITDSCNSIISCTARRRLNKKLDLIKYYGNICK